MRTNILIDEALLEEAMKISGLKTKKEVVNKALREYVDIHSRMDLMDIKGQIEFAEGYNYKSLREER